MAHEEIRKALADYKAAIEKPISIAESRALIAQFKAVMTPYFADGLLADRDRLAGEVEKHAQRLDWIRRQGDEFSSGIIVDAPGDGDAYVHGMNSGGQAKTFIEALDIAISADGGEGAV